MGGVLKDHFILATRQHGFRDYSSLFFSHSILANVELQSRHHMLLHLFLHSPSCIRFLSHFHVNHCIALLLRTTFPIRYNLTLFLPSVSRIFLGTGYRSESWHINASRTISQRKSLSKMAQMECFNVKHLPLGSDMSSVSSNMALECTSRHLKNFGIP